MPWRQTRAARRLAALEIGPTEVHLAIIELDGQGRLKAVRAESAVWRRQALTLASEQGADELASALAQLVGRHRLAGHTLSVALGGELCVTRVLTGTAERLRRGTEQLDERAALYLRLGHGQKTTACCTVPLDARHQQLLFAVANRRTVQAVLRAAERAHVHVARIEPAAVAVCRLAGWLGLDADAPIVLANVNPGGIELSIAHRGRLLLDYRPSGVAGPGEAAAVIARQGRLLARFCDANYGYVAGRLESVIVCGPRSAVDQAVAGFDPLAGRAAVDWHAALRAARPAGGGPRGTHEPWPVEALDEAPPEAAAALGACLFARVDEAQQRAPNLLDADVVREHEPLARLVMRAIWPAAAALLVAAGLLATAAVRRAQSGGLAREIADLEPVQSRVWELEQLAVAAQNKIRALEEIGRRLDRASHGGLLTSVAQSMPDDVWLERLAIEPTGTVRLTGHAYASEGVFEFVRWLQKTPGIEGVALEATAAARLPQGQVTRFELKFETSDSAAMRDRRGQANGNDSPPLSDEPLESAYQYSPYIRPGAGGLMARSR